MYRVGDKVILKAGTLVDSGSYFTPLNIPHRAVIKSIVDCFYVHLFYVEIEGCSTKGRVNWNDIQGLDTIAMMKESRDG